MDRNIANIFSNISYILGPYNTFQTLHSRKTDNRALCNHPPPPGAQNMVIKGYRTKVTPTDKVKQLKYLLDMWREKDLANVRSCDIVPDASNRSHTGLSFDHVHFLASSDGIIIKLVCFSFIDSMDGIII